MQLELAPHREAPQRDGSRGLQQHRQWGTVSSDANRHDFAEGRRTAHATGRAPLPDRSSSSMQRESFRSSHQPHRQQSRPPQPPSSPRLTPSSPRLRGSNNATETTTHPTFPLQQPFSSHTSQAPPAQQHSYCRRPSSCTLQSPSHGSNQRAYPSHLPAYQLTAEQQMHRPPTAPLSAAANPIDMQHLQQHVDAPMPYPQQNLVLEAPPPLPPLPPGASSPSAKGGHNKQAAAAAEKGNDSSDSSSSQVASQQQHSVRARLGLLERAGNGTSASFADQDRRAVTTRASAPAVQHQAAQVIDAQHGTSTLTKQQAADAVKAMIKPLYAAKALSKEQFKAVAQSCTHMLADANRQIRSSVHQVVCDCLTQMGLDQAASCL